MKRAGYTLIEVMTAVVVMTIGATGIVAMQGASVRANQDANEMSTAVNVASTWIERIKRDGRRWIANGAGDLVASNNAWLNNVTTAPGTWFVPATTWPESAAAELNGYDTRSEFITQANGDPLAFYCTNIRLTVAQAYDQNTRTSNVATDITSVRVDVRVWWYRAGNDSNRTARTCRSGPLSAAELNDPVISARFRKTYLSSVVTWKEPGWP
ncbi:MAG TPA: prepilin-type N-terminal cleavage/methylation domain-containing protein [Polyangiales bacterium]|nr:prepilin-type N-terminal cleavage/methylation domain-containing protein [Polyangiales bacterium]